MRKRFPRGGGLFPLDRRGGVVRHVIHDAVDSPDLVRDPDRDAVEDLMRDFRVHCSHAVDRVDRTDRDRLTVHAKIPVNADRLHRQEDGEVLPRKGHEAAAGRGLDLFLDDGGRASDEGHPIRRHFSDHPDRESWPGKRLALRDPHPERPGDCPDLVLVEVAQRFDELQLHVLREPADIVVGLDPIPELAPLSIQSGAIVPWTRWSAPKVFASRSKTSMNMRPMTARFFSGSTMPRNAPKNSSAAWTIRCRTPSSFRVCATSSVSPFRMSPMSM